MKKKWIWVVYLLLIAAVIGVIAVSQLVERREAQRYQGASLAYEEEVHALFAERAAIEAKIDALDDTLAAMAQNLGLGSVIVLFPEPDARLLTTVVPEMDHYAFTGMIALSDEYFPGNEGCMTVAELQALLAKGWEICLTVTADSDPAALARQVSACGLPSPQAAYFPQSNYGPDFQEVIPSLGIATVIQRRTAPPEENGVWFIGAVGSTESDSAAKLSDSVIASDCLVLTVGYVNNYERYSERNFTAMLSTISQHVNNHETVMANSRTARERYLALQAALAANEENVRAQREALNMEMDAVWNAIQAVNQKYSGM